MEKFKQKLSSVKGTILKHKKITLIIAIVLVIVGVVSTLIYKNVEYARMLANNPELAKAMTYEEVKDGDENIEGTDNVKFDAFFLRDLNGDGYAESIRGTSKEIGKEDTLYMELNVQTAGYLKDAKITINDGNFYFQTTLPKDDELKDNYIGNDVRTIEFNQLNNGTQKMITGIVRSGDYSYSSSKDAAIGNNINNYSKVNSVTLTGTYVGEDGTETPITKTVNFNIDWYGTTKATIYTNSSYNNYSDLDTRIDEENGTITLDFSVRTEETQEELILKKNHVEATIPQLNGYDPLTVEYTGSNATANYNEETKVLTIDRETQVGEDGTVTSGLSDNNSYSVKVTYPLEAYQSLGEEAVTIKIPIQTYYEGYNNPSEEFDNPYKSNTATATITANYRKPTPALPVETKSGFDITVGKYITTPSYRYVVSKQKPLSIYNGLSDKETDDIYQVRWEVYTGTNGESSGIVMKETKDGEAQGVDKFIKTDGSSESMEEVTTNVGIAISGADSLLKEDGWIKVYDEETGNLLVTFTKDNWNNYSSSNPYKYELPVKHIRVETSATNASQRMYVYNIKELDDEYITTNYTREQFDNLQYIESTLVGYMNGEYAGTDSHRANYEAPYSIADIGISNNTISTQSTEKNEKLTITARYNSLANQVGWLDGSFLVKLPEEIIDAQINDVQINNSAVSITSYELVEQNGVKLIKINTNNNNDTPQTYSITVDVDITPDPRVATVTKNIELYATNEEESDYYYNANDTYDVNDNLNTEEKVNYDTASLSMVSPNSLLTNQVGSNYDDKGSQVVSPEIADIKPVYAVVDQDKEKEATIGVQVRNNYGSTISDIQILGKIPFEGNTYVISGGDLGSTFTTKMKDTGIIVPEELQQYATVYYSENENPDRDLNKGENGWKTAEEVTNWDNVKTFLIDLGNYIMPTGAEYVFNYTVKIPNGLEFNQVSFSHHGVYFSLDTDQGKYRTQTEPNRLGFRIAEKFNLELTKYQTGKDKVIPGATYSITDEETGESKTAVTTANGTLTINNLYAEKAYTIQEIKTPSDYELNSDVIRFIGHVDEEGNLTVEKTQGNTKEDIQVIKEEGQDYKVSVKVEDEVKASIKIHKTEQGTDTNIQNVRYKLTGYNLPENGRTVTTNSNGEATISGLSINQEYTLTETKAEGYYLANPIKFRIVNNDGNYTIETTEGTIKGQETTEEDSIPTITLNIEDEKIPTYSMQIIKVKKTTESTVSDDELVAKAETALADTEVTYLEGAKFKLYKNDEVIGEYTTDGSGKVTIDNLYQYIDGKDEEATYTLKEVLAPEGYAKVKDITFKVENKDGTLQLVNTSGEEENYTVEGTTVKLTIEDSPSFRLIKKDKETQQPIANVKFAIYNVDDGEVPATNSKGEIIGTKETINGKEYYTVQTDENGELTADLTEGLYKAVEVQAPEQYDLTNQTYYFGIGASREAPEGMVLTQAQSIGGSGNDQIRSVAPTSDGGYIAGGYFYSSSIQVGNETLTNNSSSTNYSDGLIIKYSSSGEVEWAKSFGGSSYEQINSVAATSDGGAIVGGYFRSSSIQVGDETLTSNGFYDDDGLIIKYSSSGEVEWAKSIGGSSPDYIYSVAATSDGGAIAGGSFRSSSIQVGKETLTNNSSSTNFDSGIYSDSLIIKYSSCGEVEWAKSIGGSYADQINSVAATSDGGYMAGGSFRSSSIQVENETLTNNSDIDYGSLYSDGLIIKYSSLGEVEWAKSFGGSDSDYIYSVAETSDGGCIAGGYFEGTIQVGNETLTSNGSGDGLIIKYSSSGEVEWAKSFGGSSWDQINSVASTSDGGYIAGGYFEGTIQVGNEILTNNGNNDGLIIKYSSEGVVEWAKSFGGNANDQINSLAPTSDGGIIAGGYFASSSIQVGNETLKSNGSSDGLIIKYEMQELPNPVVVRGKEVGESGDIVILAKTQTADGGIAVGGYFTGTIQVENRTLKSTGEEDTLVIKYDRKGEVEWLKSYGSYGTTSANGDKIQSIATTTDGGIVVGGYFGLSRIKIGNEILNNNDNTDGFIVKLDENGNEEWVDHLAAGSGGADVNVSSITSTSNGGIIIGGNLEQGMLGYAKLQIGNYTLTNNDRIAGSTDGFIAKYNAEGEVELVNYIDGDKKDSIASVVATSDGGYIVGGRFNSNTLQVGNETLESRGYGESDGLIIKYNSSGEVEWLKDIAENYTAYINEIIQTSDGEYIATGSMLVKCNSSGEIEWLKETEGTANTIAETSDGGYITGGYFDSSSIQVGDVTLTNNGGRDGLVIKYSSTGELEWAKNIGGSSSDYIYSVAEKNDGKVVAVGSFSSDTIEVDGHILENNSNSKGMILEVVNQVGVPEVQELTVENSRKEFKITTDVKEIDGVKGGSISGEGMNPYEVVKYGDNSTKEIVMTPDENYEIIGITVNGEEWPFEENPDGTYTMPTFENMTEDKHVEVTYSLKDNKIIINKVDSEDNNKKLPGATFKLDQIEERTNPENVVGEIVANGAEYAEADLDKGEVSGVLGDLTNNGTYYFVENSDGTLAPTNSKTYQTANGGTAGVGSTTANSYIPINLSGKTGEYVIVVNAKVSSQSSNDYGYATVNTSTTAPSYSSSTGRFIYISGTTDTVTTPTDYTTVLQGGQKYYLHLGYYKNSSTSSGEDKFTVNSIKVTLNDSELYHTEVTTNNEGQAITQLPFGKYQITEVTAPEGYELNSEPIVVEFRADGNHEFTIENNKKAQVIVHHYLKDNEGNYTTTRVAEDELVEGKNGEKYTTSPKLDLSEYDLEKDVEGNYVIPENATGVFAPGVTEVIYYYEQKEIPLTVHHYIEGTTEKVPLKDGNVAEDVQDTGKEGENYQTSAIEDDKLSDDYELVETPSNSTGTYSGEEVVVTYYYKIAQRPVTITKIGEDGEPLSGVKFTIKNTGEENVQIGELTQNGKYYFVEQDGKYIANNRGENNTTASSYIKIDLSNVNNNQLLTINAQISSEESYDYGYAYITESLSEPSYGSSYGMIFEISGEEAARDYEVELEAGKVYYLYFAYEKDSTDEDELKGEDTFIINSIKVDPIGSKYIETNEQGKATINLDVGKYDITETETKEGYAIPENPTQTIEIRKDQESYELNITNKKAEGTVVTHYYIEGTEERVPSNIEGQVIEDELTTGLIGDIYITEEATNVNDRYELKEVIGEVNGIIDSEYKEIIYYYGLKDSNLTITKTNEQGEGLEGAVFKIENKENGKVNYATTGQGGKITTQVPIGESVVTEVKAPEGYKLNKESKDVTIEVNKENVITMQDEAINYYTLELSKIDAETKGTISNIGFELIYTDQYGQEFDENYITDENGKITLENLEDEIVYTIKETKTPKGYLSDTQEKQFVVHYVDGKYEIEVLQGNLKDIVIEGNTIKVNVENTPSFKLIKQDENGEPIQGVKFTIKNEEGQEVTDGFGNPVGEIEEINGEQLRVLTTNENGVIAENLVPGKYVITEVQTPSKYILPEEDKRSQTIEVTSEGFEKTYVEQSEIIDLSNINIQDIIDMNALEENIGNIDITADGKIILTSGLLKDVTISGEYTVTGEDINLQVTGGMENAVNIIITPDGKVEKAILIKTDEGSASVATNTLPMINGDYIALGMYMGTIKIPVEDTVNNQEMTLTTDNEISQFIARYNSEGKIESIKDISYLGINPNDYYNITLKDLNGKISIMYPYDNDQLTIPGSETSQGEAIELNNQNGYMIVNLDSYFKVIDAYALNDIDVKYEQEYAEPLSTGETLVSGYNNDGNITFYEDETASGERIELDNGGDGIIAKYNAEGKVEWAKELGSQAEYGGYLKTTEVSDGYVAIAYFQDGELLIPAEETKYGQEIKLENPNGDSKIALIKYTTEGKVEWATEISANEDILGDIGNDSLIKESQDGGYGVVDLNYGIVISFEKIQTEPIVKEQVVETIQNEKANGNVIIHHYKENTTESISADQSITGKIDTNYETEPATDIPENYELVTMPENATGTIKEGTTEVIYYYRLKDPSIVAEITKDSSEDKITIETSNVDYTINYKAIVKDYIGKATVTIVDELPYEIDESKPYSLAGGTYNKESKTITWTEEVTDIDTWTNGEKTIEITKEISFTYSDVDVTQGKIENKAKGTIKLDTPEKEETIETAKEIPTEYTVDIIANKVWNDNEEQSSRRPESIILVVKNGEQEVESKEVSNSNLVAGTTNKWSVEFEGLQKYDENGQEIKYTIEEKEKNPGDLHFYQAEENNVAVEDNQATIRNNFVRPEDVVSVTVTKNWNDSDNVNGRRPTSIKLQVKNGENVVSEQEVSAKNNWAYTFTDLPKYDDNGKEIEYTVAEAEVNSGDLKFYTNDSVSGDIISGYTITNTFKVPDEKVSLTVNKVWKDNAVQSLRRPKVITINVLGESGVVQSYDLNVASETSHTFTDLPKYNSNGKEISYTVEEQEKNIGDLKFYTGVVGNVENTRENNKEVTITNTFKVPDEKTNVVVTKVWEDNNDKAKKRPTSIKLLLKNGTKTLREQEISSNDAEEGNTNTWSYEFTDLDKYNSNGQEIVYTADEAEINSGDLQFYNKKVSGTTITNTFTQDTTKVEVTVNKVWVDTEAQEARRPESVVIVLKANGEEINRAEVSGENQEDKDNWSYTFKDLPKYDEFNNIINYTVDEAEANKGDLKFYSKAIDGTTITNTFTRPTETISIEVNKKWEDQENRYQKRPVSIKYQVKNGEEVVAEKIVTNKDNWEYTFEGLDKYNEEGQEITYTVDEQEVISGDLYYYEKTAGEVTDKVGSVNVKEATVTNTMVKIPSTVVVKYVDKNTGEEISEAKEKEGIIGEEFDVTEDVKEIPGYTLVEEPEEKKGTYTSEVQEKIYYYAKNTKVIVKYLEKDETEEDSDNKVLSEQIEMSGYEGEGYATNSKQIEGYTLVATKGNLSGTMTREEQVVVYYYAKNTKVIVKYLEKDDTPTDTSDNKVLLPENTIEGYVGKEYKTTEEVIPGYTLVQKTTNYEGVMTEDVIEVVYYYSKNTSVVVKYLEQDDTPDNNEDNTVLSEEIVISGYEGKSYETEKKDIENYTFVEDTENTSGKMTKEQIEVIYYYAQNTKAKVQHIDRETGKILKEETTNGKVGDLFKTHAEDFEGYVLVESPEEPNIIMDKTGTQIVKYYYAHVSAGIIEKHIDEITGELLYSEEHKGNEGDPYNIPSKEFAGYDLVTDKLPENSEGTMLRDEVIEVKYYYIKKATVVVKYVDENTGEEIAKEETIEGHENDSYETQEKQIDDYNLVKTPENASGTMVITKNEDGTYNTEIEVIYYYKKIAGGVKENHIDINTGKKLYTEEHKGNVGDKYEIPSREFEGYDLVTERLPDNSKGTMTEKEIEVNYYYEKQAKVKVEYIDKQTGEKLDEEEIKGHIGDSYETEEKGFDGYDLVEKPSNDKGEMKEEETVVKYYYERKAEVEVKYLEKGTDYEVAEGSTLNGYVGDKYETEQKEIPYYKFVEKTENWKGNMSKDKITVIYYYEKQVFNLGVDKWVSNVNINGIGGAAQNIGNKDEIYKVDIYRKDANTANVKVTYKIRITNKGEIEGTVGRLTDIIPSGYSYNKEDNEIYFENNSGVLTTDALKDEVIQPGEYKEIEVVLRWTGGEGNFGQKDNMVILTQLNNPAGYEDIDKEDNADTSSMIITVATGLDRNDRIAIIGIVQIVLVITIGLLLSYKKKEKHQDK